MAIKYIIVLFVETPRKFITAVINLRGVSTNKTIINYSKSQQTILYFDCSCLHILLSYFSQRVNSHCAISTRAFNKKAPNSVFDPPRKI
jgi:hypothetical protein